MALKKAIEQDSGYEATYWRIDRLQIDWRSKNANLRLSGYKDEAARNNNPRNSVMDQRNYRIGGQQFKKFFDVPDPADYPAWDSGIDYGAGEIVSYEDALYQATDPVSSGGSDPKASSSWELYADLRVNRRIAYEYIKNNDIDLNDAVDA